MSVIGALLPVSLFLGGLGLLAFVWSLRSGQFEDLEGDQHRALFMAHDAAPDAGPDVLAPNILAPGDIARNARISDQE